MATWAPITGAVVQRVLASGLPASGYVLKLYAAGTSTNIPIATDTSGATQANYATYNATGDVTVSGNTIIPHVNQDYKLCIYATQAAADADSGAVISIDNIPAPSDGSFVVNDAVNTGVTNVVTISHTTTGTPTAGIGTGLAFVTETSTPGTETGMVLESVTTDVSVGSEDFDYVVKLMAAGAAAAERFRVKSTGQVITTGPVDQPTGSSIASASTINLDTATGRRVHITGTTTITAVTLTKGPRTVIFDGILTLTHHSTNNNLPGAANITTAAGDRAIYESDGTTVYCVAYTRADGTTVAGIAAPQATMETATNNTNFVTPLSTKWHPGVAKCWIKANGAGTTINASHNITSITDDGTGLLTVTIADDFSSADYAIAASINAGGSDEFVSVSAQAAGSFSLRNRNPGAAILTDPTSYFAVCFGDQ